MIHNRSAMTKSEFEDLLLHFSKCECTKEENLEIREWFKRIEVKQHFKLTAKEKALLEAKMLMEIDNKIEQNERLAIGKNLSTGFIGTYIIYAGIAASLIMAGFLVKKIKSVSSLIKNESPFKLNQSAKMSLISHKAGFEPDSKTDKN